MIMNDSQLYATGKVELFFVKFPLYTDAKNNLLPKYRNNNDAMNDNIDNDTTSPIEAAKGVARLSGFRLNL